MVFERGRIMIVDMKMAVLGCFCVFDLLNSAI
jgi:hypothetical protein